MNDEPSLMIIDVLPADPFREAHLPTAENFCVYESAFVSKVLGAHANPSQPIVVYGERSGTLEAEIAAEKLQAARGSDSFFLGRRFHRTNCGKSWSPVFSIKFWVAGWFGDSNLYDDGDGIPRNAPVGKW